MRKMLVQTLLAAVLAILEGGGMNTRKQFIRDGFGLAAISNRNARLKTTMSKGVPAALAAARLRRAEEKETTNIVNVVVQPGAK